MGRRRSCGYTFLPAGQPEPVVCRRRTDHHCEPRALRAVEFFELVLVHTKGPWARQPFRLEGWQRDEIVRPLFGDVRWSDEWGRYVRRYSVAWIEVARKNGKSELAAGIALLLMLADDEESAEVYGAAKDTKQAGKIWEVAERMTKLSPVLRNRPGLGVNRNTRRIYDSRTGSYYEMITADAAGELGHNPAGGIIDEVIAQPSRDLYDSLRTAEGARPQPLFLMLTTAGTEDTQFAKHMHAEMVRVSEDPTLAPHVFTFIRNTPVDADPWDETNWAHANPALGSFLSVETLRKEALEARNDPAAENSFRQFRLNQWVATSHRWMPMHLWRAHPAIVAWDDLTGLPATAGVDLAATSDLAAACWLASTPGGYSAVWRYWANEEAAADLNKRTAGRFAVWVREGWVTVTDGNVIDYERVALDLESDAERFAVDGMRFDRWNATATATRLQTAGLPVTLAGQGYGEYTAAMKEAMRLVKQGGLAHGGNPVTDWCMSAVEAKVDSTTEHMRPIRPDRRTSNYRVDGATAFLMAVAERLTRDAATPAAPVEFVRL